MTLPLRIHATTHVGHHHPRNEDAHAIVPLDEGRAVLLVVCDGMGGMGRGDEASRIYNDCRHVLHFGFEIGEAVDVDCRGGRLHLVDRIVH